MRCSRARRRQHSASPVGWHARTPASMLPRVRAPAHVPMLLLLAISLGSSGACGDDGATQAPSEPEPAPALPIPAAPDDEAAPSWSERLAQPSVADLLAALAQPHAVTREHVGPHQLQVTTDVELLGTEPAPAVVPLDGPVVEDRSVHDELALRWAAPIDDGPDPGPRLSLSQANDHERGRDVVVIGPTVHVRHAHRPWYHYPLDGDLLELWLDDAQRSVHDAVRLAAPRLSLRAAPVDGAGLAGGPAVEITLARAEGDDRSLVAAGPTQAWRAAAEIEAVEGTLRLDAQSGAWLSADLDVRYRLPAADGRTLAGRLRLRAQLAPGSGGTIAAPEGSRPLPQRLRYDDEQRRLLDGLAAP